MKSKGEINNKCYISQIQLNKPGGQLCRVFLSSSWAHLSVREVSDQPFPWPLHWFEWCQQVNAQLCKLCSGMTCDSSF